MTLKTTTFITLGSGNEFGVSDDSMFLRHCGTEDWDQQTIDLGAPTKENFNELLNNMSKLKGFLT